MFNGICHSRGERKRIHLWIPLLGVIGKVGISFLPFIKDSPHRSSLKHLKDGGSSDAARSLNIPSSLEPSDTWKRAIVDPN
jgi:hypothetical protein